MVCRSPFFIIIGFLIYARSMKDVGLKPSPFPNLMTSVKYFLRYMLQKKLVTILLSVENVIIYKLLFQSVFVDLPPILVFF